MGGATFLGNMWYVPCVVLCAHLAGLAKSNTPTNGPHIAHFLSGFFFFRFQRFSNVGTWASPEKLQPLIPIRQLPERNFQPQYLPVQNIASGKRCCYTKPQLRNFLWPVKRYCKQYSNCNCISSKNKPQQRF